MIQVLNKLANGKLALLFFLGTAYMSLVTFPKYEKEINAIAGQEIEALDGRTHYSFDEVQETFSAAGEEARNAYAHVVRVVDTIFPFVYGLFFIYAIAFFIVGIKSLSKLIVLSLLPVGAMLFDFLENANTLSMLSNYPNFTIAQVKYGSTMSMLKWLFVFASASVLILSMSYYLFLKFQRR